jgi:hypothetical protein
MVMLVGIQGSGKSQISSQLEQQGYVVASNDRFQLIVNIFIRTKGYCFLDLKKIMWSKLITLGTYDLTMVARRALHIAHPSIFDNGVADP